MRPIIVDIAEFMANPVRSGIQRVVRELVTKWPKDVPVVFARYDNALDGLVALAARDLRNAVDDIQSGPAALTHTSSPLHPIALTANDVVLVPEVFYGPKRVAFYADVLAKRRCKVGFVVFDFVPWLNPSAITLGASGSALIMPYLMLLLRAQYRCFISAAVRDDFVHRIARGFADESGPVFPLGADSFNLARQPFSPDRVDIVCLGTLDGKKGQDIVFDAFEATRCKARGRLVCLGRVPENPSPLMRKLLTSSRNDVSVVDSPTETEIVESLARARASVFVSMNEGFGLPAVESLHCGIPIVAHEQLPCLAGLQSAGQIRLPQVTVETVGAALMRVAEDGEARALWSDLERLRLHTWADYAASLAGWTKGMSKSEPVLRDRAVSTALFTGSDTEARHGAGR